MDEALEIKEEIIEDCDTACQQYNNKYELELCYVEKSKSDWDGSRIIPSREYEHQKNTFRTILEHHKEIQNQLFKSMETNFTHCAEIEYNNDDDFEIKEEILQVEDQDITRQKYKKEYESQSYTVDEKEIDNSAVNYTLQSKNRKEIQEPEQELENKYKCEKCARSYKRKCHLNYHKKFECGVRPQFRCELCGKKFKRKRGLTCHVNSVHHKKSSKKPALRHECNMCSRSYTLLRNLYQHKRLDHSEDKTQFICDYCGYKTKYKWTLSAHITASHLKTPKPRHNCNKCSRSYTSLKGLNLHTRSEHSKVKPQYVCEYCDYKTNRKSYLSKHTTLRHLK
ncbi:zinc finger protein 493-like [Belonocnema kinseyi]|uniref:zinc finger protein 493-like n=1 Tax=Belonocnema kinseyi TaxID=2817044 RepID=UPI00143CCAD1|nr:zinc finger protein 493-like [Belonocnema kinseyi]